MYLWDKAASVFCQKFRYYGSNPRVLLVTTVNPTHLGGRYSTYKPSYPYSKLSWLISKCIVLCHFLLLDETVIVPVMDNHILYLLLIGTLALTSMSSSRVFMDTDVQPSREYLEW